MFVAWRKPQSEAVTCETRNDVEVEVKDLLVSGRPVGEVQRHSFAADTGSLQSLGNILSGQKHRLGVVAADIGKTDCMPDRHHKDMPLVNRLDIHESCDLIVAVDEGGANLAS